MADFNFFELDNLLGIPIFYIKTLIGFLLSIFLTMLAIPKIMSVSYRKNLMDEPIGRSSHARKIPNLGGLAIFFAISIVGSIFAYELFGRYIFLFACMVILMFVGLMDDILVVAPDKKLYAQFITALMLILGSNIRIGDFFGVLGIQEINYYLSILFTLLFFIVFINSFNFIDGIDGLAGGISIVIFGAFAYSFYILDDLPMVVFCMIIVGSVLGFLFFNLSKHHKIFMGDTGSLLLGFLITFMMIRFLHLLMDKNADGTYFYHLPTAPAIAIAILIIPIIDSITVTSIRLKNGLSPFHADKNHLHHQYLKVGLSHIQTTVILVTANIMVLLFAYFIRKVDINSMVVLVLLSGFVCTYVPILVIKRLKLKKIEG